MNDLKRKARLVVIVCALLAGPVAAVTAPLTPGTVLSGEQFNILSTRATSSDRTDPSRWDRWQRAFADKIFAMRRVSLTDDQIHTAVVRERLPCVPALRICTAPILGARLRLANSCPS